MTGLRWEDLLIGIASAMLLAWVALLIALVIVRPRSGLLREALRLLPDVLRLVRRLAADTSQPRGVRIRLVLFTGSGFYQQAGLLPLAFALLPFAVIGYLVGSRLHARLSTRRAVQAVWALLIVGGTSLVLRAIAMP